MDLLPLCPAVPCTIETLAGMGRQRSGPAPVLQALSSEGRTGSPGPCSRSRSLTKLPGVVSAGCAQRSPQAPAPQPLSWVPSLLSQVPHPAAGLAAPSQALTARWPCLQVVVSLPPWRLSSMGDRDCVCFAHRGHLADIGCINEFRYSSFHEP